MLDPEKNAGVVAAWGDMYRNPFSGGFLALPQEHSFQRVGTYTKTGRPEVREGRRKGVTCKFIDDSFTRFVVQDHGSLPLKIMRPAGSPAAPRRASSSDRTWTLFHSAKLTHPGVEVLPGEPRSKWREVCTKWIGYIPRWMGSKEGFQTDYIEAHTVAPRELWNDTLEKKLRETLGQYLLPGEDGTLNTSIGEFFDELTAYTNILIKQLGAARCRRDSPAGRASCAGACCLGD